jgi:hypothetical protein
VARLTAANGSRSDLDGITTGGTTRFLSGFDGRLRLRLVAQPSNVLYAALRGVTRGLGWRLASDSSVFT